jgi:hypothetical protein
MGAAVTGIEPPRKMPVRMFVLPESYKLKAVFEDLCRN